MNYPTTTVTVTTEDFNTAIATLAERTGETITNIVFTDIGSKDGRVFQDNYRIRASKSNLGWGVMCRLNGENCYHADQTQVGNKKLFEIINDINGCVIADKNGFVL